MDRMDLRNPPIFQNRDVLGNKPKFDKLTYTLSGYTQTYEGRSVEGVRIKFADRLSGVEAAHAWTDANGRFTAVVQVNSAGYRVTASKVDWGFSPAYYDAFDQTEVIWFRGKYYGKGDSKEPDPK
jgi:hypothetical protein